MPSYNQEINVDLNSNENGALKTDAKDGKIDESRYMSAEQIPNNAPVGLNADQEIAFALRDFLTPSSTALSDAEPSPSALSQTLPFIDEQVDGDDATHSEEELQQTRETEEVLNNAACRLRRWRAASRKLRRPRIINNLSSKDEKESNISKVCNSGHTDLADRLRSLAAAGSMSASAGELLSLAPPPPAATAPPSPGCLLSPSLADQSSAEYFVSLHNSLSRNIVYYLLAAEQNTTCKRSYQKSYMFRAEADYLHNTYVRTQAASICVPKTHALRRKQSIFLHKSKFNDRAMNC